MRASYEIGDLTVEAGQIGRGWIRIGQNVLGHLVGIPLIVYHGAAEGKTILVDAATHGDEYETTLGLLLALRGLDPKKMAGTLIAVPALNAEALEGGTRGSSIEIHQYDLNRSYPGEPNGSPTQRLAHTYIKTVVQRADAVLSFHGGGTPFYLSGYNVAMGNLDLVRAMGWKRFTSNPDASVSSFQGTLYFECQKLGIPSLTCEIGGNGYRTPEILARTTSEYRRGMHNVLIHYGLIDGTADRPETLFRIHKMNQRSTNGGLVELGNGIDVEAEVEEGQLIFRILSLFGDVVEEHRAPFKGRMMGLPGSPIAFAARIMSSVYRVEEEIPTVV